MEGNLQRQQSVFWIEVDKIKPNPMQPRREFDEEKLKDLAESIRQYGVLQPLVVVRKETETESGISVEYELIAGERRLRASKMAGLYQVPVIIREDVDDKVKLEMAIIENLQREDLNPVERALAFKQLTESFGLKQSEVADRIGKSRVFVTNTLRILKLPQEIKDALQRGEITEGHTRPLLMLIDRPEEQKWLYQEIVVKKLNVREAEALSRKIASERARKRESEFDPAIKRIEEELAENLGTRVKIEKTGERGKILIDFFSEEELSAFLERIKRAGEMSDQKREEAPLSNQERSSYDSGAEEKPLSGGLEEGLSSFESAGPDDDLDDLKSAFTI